jgi:hypothetical protein
MSKPEIITTKHDGTPCVPYAALTVGPLSVRASHMWATPGIHISKVGKTALAFGDVPALIDALHAVMAAAPQVPTDPTPTPLPTSEATPDVAAIVQAVMAAMAAKQ